MTTKISSPEDLFIELLQAVAAYKSDFNRELLERAYGLAQKAHAGQLRCSGEPFVIHPMHVAHILAVLRLDEAALAAALLHDVVEDTEIAGEQIVSEFGSEIADLVEGVTKLSKIHFRSREAAEAENYRKMILAMSSDVRVIIIKLADRLHNMRTIDHLNHPRQVKIARETLEIYAPIAHRLGLGLIKWELEDRAFQVLHPRKYEELKVMVADRREDREAQIAAAKEAIIRKLAELGVQAEVSGRAKHFYSIYDKMTRKEREFNEIYDLSALRVIVEREGALGIQDCYAVLGAVHSLGNPMPGRVKDYIALPKLNHYRALHTTVIGPDGRPLEVQIRTREMDETAEYGVAAHWLYKLGPSQAADAWRDWVKHLLDWQGEVSEPGEFMSGFRSSLLQDEVYVFTPAGEVKRLPAGATPIDFAYAVHTDVGHATVGAKVNGRMVPLHYRLHSGDFVEVLTAKKPHGPSRDWMDYAVSSRARSKIRGWFAKQQPQEDTERKGRDALEAALKAQGLSRKRILHSRILAEVIREASFKHAADFYVALGSGKLKVKPVVNQIIAKLKTSEVVLEPVASKPSHEQATSAENIGISVAGVSSVLLRLAKCCTPVPGDEIVGYVSMGKGITVHRDDCPNVRALRKNPDRFTEVSWEGVAERSFLVQISLDAWDRPRLLEDVARTIAEAGANIVSYGGTVDSQTARNWYTIEIGDISILPPLLTLLKQINGVFDAYRLTPGGKP